MIQKLCTNLVAVAFELLLVMGTLQACKEKQAMEGSPPVPGQNAESKLPEHRVALVIGNSRYRYVSYLKNPRNDAYLVAKSLKAVGFELIDGGPQIDLDKETFDRVVQDFGNALQDATTALFYYAGHGIELNGSNYLIPISANPIKQADVDFQMVDIETVLHQMEDGKARFNILILDACRNNPFGGRGLRGSGSGLGQMEAPEGTLISYAAQPHAVAKDGDGDDSPYSAALAETIRTPGLDIWRAFNEVGLSVQKQTGGKQQPWTSTSPLEGEFYFVKPLAPTPVVAAAAVPTLTAPTLGEVLDPDVVYWWSMRDTNNPEFLKSYLKQFPSGRFADLARLRLETQQPAQTQQKVSRQPTAVSSAAINPVQTPNTNPVQASQTFTAITKAPIDRETAKTLRHRLAKSGYKSRLVPAEIGDETGYRIEVGPFTTQAEAGAAQTTLDELTTQVAMSSAIQSHPALVQPKSPISTPEPKPEASNYTVQLDRFLTYNDAIVTLARAAKLGYQAHLVPKTVNGEREYGIEIDRLRDERQAAEARKKVDQLVLESYPTGSLQQPNSNPLPPLAVVPTGDANQLRRTKQDRGLYRIDVEDTSDHGRAQMLMERLQRLGYTPQLLTLRNGGQNLYQIEIGGFASEDDAEAAEDELQQRYSREIAADFPRTISNSKPQNAKQPKANVGTDHNRIKAAPTAVATATPAQIASARVSNEGTKIEFSFEPEGADEISLKRNSSATHVAQGERLFAARDLDAASAQFRKAVELDPTNADAFYAWGLTLYAKRDLDGCVANFRKATSLKPNYANAYYNWGLALYDQGEFRDAGSKFEKAVELHPGYANAYYNWGLALSRTGDLDGAIDKFQQATNLNPGYADAYYGWGAALYHQHQFGESIAKYRKALELKPANQTYKRALMSALTAQQNSRAGFSVDVN